MQAFALARQRMLANNFPARTVDMIEAVRNPRSCPVGEFSDDELHKAASFVWYGYAPTGDARRIERLTVRLGEYPDDVYRILPTRLGNILRAYEQRTHDPRSGSVEGMVLRVADRLPPTIQRFHSDCRNRLDLYCSLVSVSGIATALAMVLLWTRGWQFLVLSAATGIVFALLSYSAALASARAYGAVLEAIKATNVS
jgi:hypothetical protein